MKAISRGLVSGLVVVALAAWPAGAQAGADTLVALDTLDQLRTFDGATPGSLSVPVDVTGLHSDYSLESIDRRPATGELYGLGVNFSSARLYKIDMVTGAATAVGDPIDVVGNNEGYSLDFDPVSDVLRLVAETPDLGCPDGGEDEYFVFNPTTGAATEQTPVGYATDPDCAMVSGIAHSNNFPGATTTTLFALDMNDKFLTTVQGSVLTPVGELSGGFFAGPNNLVGFDIAPDGSAYLTAVEDISNDENLYAVNLATGAVTLIGPLDDGSQVIQDVAVLASAPDPDPGDPDPDPANVAPALSVGQVGKSIEFTLSEAATIRITIQRALKGRRSKGRCRKPRKKLRDKPRCTRWKTVGTLTHSGTQGKNSVAFSGKVARKKLKPGRYRALIEASDSAGARSPKLTLRFRIAKPKPKPKKKKS